MASADPSNAWVFIAGLSAAKLGDVKTAEAAEARLRAAREKAATGTAPYAGREVAILEKEARRRGALRSRADDRGRTAGQGGRRHGAGPQPAVRATRSDEARTRVLRRAAARGRSSAGCRCRVRAVAAAHAKADTVAAWPRARIGARRQHGGGPPALRGARGAARRGADIARGARGAKDPEDAGLGAAGRLSLTSARRTAAERCRARGGRHNPARGDGSRCRRCTGAGR